MTIIGGFAASISIKSGRLFTINKHSHTKGSCLSNRRGFLSEFAKFLIMIVFLLSITLIILVIKKGSIIIDVSLDFDQQLYNKD